ncbi:hypothetical protein AA309_27550 [Microvirga vignae]|uniref:Response regulatory domain-containing protein n=1 Tax=Microvirga vignae TaxID=1225564 RepID=A0A0H1R4Q2_9HYPH|nr:hypothetical protein [Microvirga vignae]KLK90113.1 hypothetical protein AA309_27550 [Microvirga vignae]
MEPSSVRGHAALLSRSNVRGEAVRNPLRERILILKANGDFRSSLALVLREADFAVMTAVTGERAFRLLHDWRRQVDRLYSQATLPGLIDGWILADQHHDNHPNRPAIIVVESEKGPLMMAGTYENAAPVNRC